MRSDSEELATVLRIGSTWDTPWAESEPIGFNARVQAQSNASLCSRCIVTPSNFSAPPTRQLSCAISTSKRGKQIPILINLGNRPRIRFTAVISSREQRSDFAVGDHLLCRERLDVMECAS